MPIYNFSCRACGRAFEELVRGDAAVTCPDCRSAQVERTLSLPARPVMAGKSADFSKLGPPPDGGCCGGGCHTH